MRVYLDHNATTPLRQEARSAMAQAMDLAGNPSSLHAEGRAAKGLVERARAQVAQLVGCSSNQVIFTSGATEAAALAVAQKHAHGGMFAAFGSEHECFVDWSEAELPAPYGLAGTVAGDGGAGLVALMDVLCHWAGSDWKADRSAVALIAMSAANSETGIMMPKCVVPGNCDVHAGIAGTLPYSVVSDLTQVAGKMPVVFSQKRPSYAVLSAHKLAGPKGVGALINFTAQDPRAILRGGGQEMGRRSGTENVIGIAGFGAAAEAAQSDLENGSWARVAKLRNILESAIEASEKETIFVGKDAERLPNTTCMLTPGWKGETQVMQMDLSGFAISAGSACSSGKVKASRVLQAMGYAEDDASCAIRVSLGLQTTEDEVLRFADCWLAARAKHKARAA
ncbi:MAG: aminotransferase class V-fold PLP-dependent enzyme [Pseudomonadota bacterium]